MFLAFAPFARKVNINKQIKPHVYFEKIQALGKLVISIFAEYLTIIIISLTLFRRVGEPILELAATPRDNGGNETQRLLAAQPAARAVLRENYEATQFPSVGPDALATSNEVSAIRDQVERKIREEWITHSMLSTDFTSDTVAYLAPGPSAKALQVLHWNLISKRGGQMFVSDEDLAIALCLEEQTDENKTPSESGSQIYYVRSWALTIDEYDGSQDGPRKFLRRHVWASPRHCVSFLNALQRFNPTAYGRVRVFLFPSATLNPNVAPRLRKERELQIIAFLGCDTVLNQDASFSNIMDYQWDYQYGVQFHQLQTDFFRNVLHHGQTPTQAMIDRVQAWREAVEEFANENPTGTSTAVHPLSAAYLATLFEQALPLTVAGITVLAVAGKDVTRGDYLASKRQPFLGTGTQGPDSVAGELTRGREPSSAAAAYFIHPDGLGPHDFLSTVGLPFVATFADPNWTEKSDVPPAGYEVLVIPHLDPSFVDYQWTPAARDAVLNVIDVTWQITVAASYYVVEYLFRMTDRSQLIYALYTYVSPSSPAEQIQDLFATLERAKQTLQAVLNDHQARQSAPPATARSDERDKESTDERILRAGFALGAPGSQQRVHQITTMWRRHYPDVQLQLTSRSREQEDYWKQWARLLAEGTSFMLASMHAAVTVTGGISDSLRQVLRQRAPSGASDDSWMTDAAQRKAALDTKGWQLRASWGPEQFSLENQRTRAVASYPRSRSDPLLQYTSILEGREVAVWANCKVPVYWTDPQTGVNHQVMLSAPMAAVCVDDNDSRRFLTFLPRGIGLRNETGTHYALQRNSPMMHGILRQDQFHLANQGTVIQQMWQLERARIAPTTPPSAFSVAGAKPPGRRPSAPLNVAPAPNDALFLVHRWLDQVFPNGGYFQMGNENWTVILRPPHVDVRSLVIESVWTTWGDYMRSQLKHPYSATLAGYGPTRENLNSIIACVAACRVIVDEGHVRVPGGRECKWLRVAGKATKSPSLISS
ncbi:hypothetical protein HDU88_000520 [Geranomyces variabilis]|nr:hypothetical protein HDU88_000520 [Geranomyces variabilis]